jgi:hypothetical protein
MMQRDVLNAACSLGRNEFKLGGSAPDHSAEASDGIIASNFTQKIYYLGQFK